MANLIDKIPMLNPFDLKTGIFKHTDTNVILIHKIDVVNGIVVLSKGSLGKESFMSEGGRAPGRLKLHKILSSIHQIFCYQLSI